MKLRQTNQPNVTAGSAPLSPHYIIIRPQQTLLLVRIYCKLFVFKYILKIVIRISCSQEWFTLKGDTLYLFCMVTFCTEHYTLEVAGSQSWPYQYYIGPKRGKDQVCLTRQCLHLFPSRWCGLESPEVFGSELLHSTTLHLF